VNGSLRVALLQGPAGLPGGVAESLKALDEAAREAAGQGARLLVTSEMFLTGYALGETVRELAEPAGGASAQEVAAIAARHGLAIVHGYPERDGERVYNAARLTGPDGTALADYRKTHLFGAYEQQVFTPGERPLAQADLDGTRIGLLICYDVEFPELVRAHALAGTEVLAVPTALMRPYDFVPDTLVPTRAWENGFHIAYANRCGPEGEWDFAGRSCLAGPDGTVLARAGAGPRLLVADADPAATAAARADTPYLTDRRPELYGALTVGRAPRSATR